jgi:hypothetical protein
LLLPRINRTSGAEEERIMSSSSFTRQGEVRPSHLEPIDPPAVALRQGQDQSLLRRHAGAVALAAASAAHGCFDSDEESVQEPERWDGLA